MIHPQNEGKTEEEIIREDAPVENNVETEETSTAAGVSQAPVPQAVPAEAPKVFMTPAQEKQAFATAAAPMASTEMAPPSYSLTAGPSMGSQPPMMMMPPPVQQVPQMVPAQQYAYQPQNVAGTMAQSYGYAQGYPPQQQQPQMQQPMQPQMQQPILAAPFPNEKQHQQPQQQQQFQKPPPQQGIVFGGQPIGGYPHVLPSIQVPVPFEEEVQDEYEKYHPERRIGGFIVAPTIAVLWLASTYYMGLFYFDFDPRSIFTESSYSNLDAGPKYSNEFIVFTLFAAVAALGSLLNFVFHVIVCVPGYISGKPKLNKFIPALLGTFIFIVGLTGIYLNILTEDFSKVKIAGSFIVPIILTVFSYFAFMGNDKRDSFWNNLKPWTAARNPLNK